ncbi:sensor domain-containing protein [Mumia sp. zg.B17]|uniref:sensor histidine kinase n=1 Tax=Mumia sp. zg.B17 TaxID=2855446 RepID=UPI001C6F19B3|nr:sensor histidine kinase [Mumia sp. zg.B17]MBW9206321.1 sensor domain-containing protein [Mumia sp. zg.B17]
MDSEQATGPGRSLRGRLRDAVHSTGYTAYGAGIGLLAAASLPFGIVVAVLWFLRVGRRLVLPSLAWLRWLSDLERERLRRLGYVVAEPLSPSGSPEEQAADPATRRELGWLVIHGTFGVFLGAVVVQLLLITVHDLAYPLWWQYVGVGEQELLNGLLPASSDSRALLGPVIAVIAFALWFLGAPRLLRWQAEPGLRLLGPPPGTDLSARVAQLTATRAAALDAHTVELRRIERALHDGAQNRVVGVAVLIGAARREVPRDPVRAEEILARAQDTTEDALAELRAVVRSILPPVLENRGLAGAVNALAADCAVPCTVTIDVPVRCPASVEATAYFVIAEALTNVSKHSRADRAEVEVRLDAGRLHVRVGDDGRGGADPADGTGLAGIIRRVEALDGRAWVTSPRGGPTEVGVELPCGS